MTGASINYGGEGCSITFTPEVIYTDEGLALQWNYSGGSPCSNVAATVGEIYNGLVTLSKGIQIPFSGNFTD